VVSFRTVRMRWFPSEVILLKVELPNEVRELCLTFLQGLNDVLGEKMHGLYIYGAVAFPEGGATGDVDFHVILSGVLDEREKGEFKALHAALARDYPPLGGELDGYYILLEDACQTSLPAHQWLEGVVDDSWALHRAHILAGRCIVLHGPDPVDVFPVATWPELAEALQRELDFVEAHLDEYPAYCVLNLCRLMYSYETRDVVVSKRASAKWARVAYPEWQRPIDVAEKVYDQKETTVEQEFLRSDVKRFFDFACGRIQETLL